MGNPPGAFDGAGRHRFFVAPAAVDDDRVTFSAEQARQLRRVLRLATGDRVVICPGDGREGLTILRMDGPMVTGGVERWSPGLPEPDCAIWLYQSALRGDRFTWLLQKGTEIGVRGFAPLRFRYTQQADYAHRLDRYRAVVREAAEQCGRSSLPAVLPAQEYARAVADGEREPGTLRLLLDEGERSRSLREAIAGAGTPPAIHLFVGPEGGLHPEERIRAREYGVQAVGIGRRILRSETAGIVAATLALAATGELD